MTENGLMGVAARVSMLVVVLAVPGTPVAGELSYPVVDTGQESCYDERGRVIACPPVGDDLSGQDTRHAGNQPSYRDNGDGTVSDLVTGLMWQKVPTGGVSWDEAVAGASRVTTGGYNDWRLPNAKELQSIVVYSRAPDVTGSPAIDPVFETTPLGDGEYPYYWTSTTHLDGRRPGEAAVYIAFGRALGYMRPRGRTGPYRLLDVHGAGAQRSDPKTGDPADFPHGRGPQGDVIRIFNFVRLVRDVEGVSVTGRWHNLMDPAEAQAFGEAGGGEACRTAVATGVRIAAELILDGTTEAASGA